MRLSVTLVVAALMLPSAPAFSQAQEPAKADDGQKVVCKNERFVGSNIGQRVCKTKAEWEEGRKNAQKALDDRSKRREQWRCTECGG